MTNDTYTGTTSSAPLGAALDQQHLREATIIGQIDQSKTGNTILRIGRVIRSGEHQGSWYQTEHLVLTVDERERLINILTLQRPD